MRDIEEQLNRARWYSGPREIEAFVEAEFDRIKHRAGEGSEPHINEPSLEEITKVQRRLRLVR